MDETMAVTLSSAPQTAKAKPASKKELSSGDDMVSKGSDFKAQLSAKIDDVETESPKSAKESKSANETKTKGNGKTSEKTNSLDINTNLQLQGDGKFRVKTVDTKENALGGKEVKNNSKESLLITSNAENAGTKAAVKTSGEKQDTTPDEVLVVDSSVIPLISNVVVPQNQDQTTVLATDVEISKTNANVVDDSPLSCNNKVLTESNIDVSVAKDNVQQPLGAEQIQVNSTQQTAINVADTGMEMTDEVALQTEIKGYASKEVVPSQFTSQSTESTENTKNTENVASAIPVSKEALIAEKVNNDDKVILPQDNNLKKMSDSQPGESANIHGVIKNDMSNSLQNDNSISNQQVSDGVGTNKNSQENIVTVSKTRSVQEQGENHLTDIGNVTVINQKNEVAVPTVKSMDEAISEKVVTDIANGVTEKIDQGMKDNMSFEVHLYPKNLGKVSIRMSSYNGLLTIEVSAQNSKAQQVILSGAGELKSLLQSNLHQDVVVHVPQNAEHANQHLQDENQQSSQHHNRNGYGQEKQKSEQQDNDKLHEFTSSFLDMLDFVKSNTN